MLLVKGCSFVKCVFEHAVLKLVEQVLTCELMCDREVFDTKELESLFGLAILECANLDESYPCYTLFDVNFRKFCIE